MDSSFRFIRPRPLCSHPHHQHHHHHPLCHRHHHHHHHQCHHHFCPSHNHCHHHHYNCHCLVCPRFAPHPLRGPELIGSYPPLNDLADAHKETASITQVLQDPGHNVSEEEEEEEGDPIFVLTDEWREFFAKSEAKRKLEKQQAKKKRQTLIGNAGHALDLVPSNAQP
ncbi:hypothetical protein P3X46_017950 [Hevea brasiliensis]|uniref:SKI-interacting protein SKIP SNW domain-containing protein n=1 Tax=Hevea brasiliensis TaxID=3981 RepID=A0ABQ9LP95_HEVBR|nr:uncharacterized protein LOC110667437 [Hevea brasiliensis]KAJ9169799.1 hypothetical protein P3X46_017950 [Hevea brasiliensis]